MGTSESRSVLEYSNQHEFSSYRTADAVAPPHAACRAACRMCHVYTPVWSTGVTVCLCTEQLQTSLSQSACAVSLSMRGHVTRRTPDGARVSVLSAHRAHPPSGQNPSYFPLLFIA